MSGNERTIGKCVFIPQHTIVANMAVGHEKIPRPYDGILIRCVGAMNGDMLSKYIVVSDAQLCGRSLILQILRSAPDNSTCMNLVFPAHGHLSGQVNMRTYFAIWANNHPCINYCIRTNIDGFVYAGLWVDDSRGMNG